MDVVRALWPVAALSTPIMMVEMGVLQLVESRGTPGHVALALGVAAFVLAVIAGVSSSSPRAAAAARGGGGSCDGLAISLVAVYAAALVAIAFAFDPAAHRSTGVHQRTGPCGVEAIDITGNVRHEFLCATNFSEDYDFRCADAPAHGATWYSVCGRAHSNFGTWIAGVSIGASATLALTLVWLS
jgi:hypothetical protein